MPADPSQASFRQVMSHFASGVTVMTTCLGEQLHGMTVSAFASVSLEPLLVLACVEKVTRMHDLVTKSKVFAVNVLPEREQATSVFFADDARLQGPEFTGDIRRGITGCPLLPRATAYLEARVQAAYDGGDHAIFLGEVVALDVLAEQPPLIYYRHGYTGLKG